MDFVTVSTGLILPYWMGLPIRYIQDTVTKQIGTLSDFPQKFHIVDDPVLASWEIRFIIINNYLAFYTINEEKQTVTVVRFLYKKSNWCSILRQGFSLV